MKVKAVKINQICIFVLVQVFCSASSRKAAKRGGVTTHTTLTMRRVCVVIAII